MNFAALKSLFKTELSAAYSKSEIDELYSIFIKKKLGLSKFESRRKSDEIVEEHVIQEFGKIIDELKTGKPFQQILGETEFYGLKFFVDENVLIPRPETEELLELAIQKVQVAGCKLQGFKILDIGTGSGIIPIVLKKYFPDAEISAIDYSEKALDVSKKNADFHKTEIHFIHQDYLCGNLDGVYNVIISNPPYIGIDEENEIADSVKEFEPKMALFSPTANPLVFYEKIAEDSKNHLSENGMVLLEINQKLGNETADLFRNVLSVVELKRDISGNERFVFGRK